MDHIGLAPPDVLGLKQYVALQRTYTDRISFALILQLLARNLDTTAVIQELDQLEDIGSKTDAEPERQFSIPPLTAFWRRHINVDACATSSLAVRWQPNRQSGGQAEAQIVQRANDKTSASEDKVNWPAERIRSERRAEQSPQSIQSAGSWLIYVRNNEKNYYLALASPRHLEIYAAQELFGILKSESYEEFPFLFEEESASET